MRNLTITRGDESHLFGLVGDSGQEIYAGKFDRDKQKYVLFDTYVNTDNITTIKCPQVMVARIDFQLKTEQLEPGLFKVKKLVEKQVIRLTKITPIYVFGFVDKKQVTVGKFTNYNTTRFYHIYEDYQHCTFDIDKIKDHKHFNKINFGKAEIQSKCKLDVNVLNVIGSDFESGELLGRYQKGNKIFVIGKYDKEKQKFVVFDWLKNTILHQTALGISFDDVIFPEGAEICKNEENMKQEIDSQDEIVDRKESHEYLFLTFEHANKLYGRIGGTEDNIVVGRFDSAIGKYVLDTKWHEKQIITENSCVVQLEKIFFPSFLKRKDNEDTRELNKKLIASNDKHEHISLIKEHLAKQEFEEDIIISVTTDNGSRLIGIVESTRKEIIIGLYNSDLYKYIIFQQYAKCKFHDNSNNKIDRANIVFPTFIIKSEVVKAPIGINDVFSSPQKMHIVTDKDNLLFARINPDDEQLSIIADFNGDYKLFFLREQYYNHYIVFGTKDIVENYQMKLVKLKPNTKEKFTLVISDQYKYNGEVKSDNYPNDVLVHLSEQREWVDVDKLVENKFNTEIAESITRAEQELDFPSKIINEMKTDLKDKGNEQSGQQAFLLEIPIYGALIRLYVDVTDEFIQSDLKKNYPDSDEVNQIELGYLLDMSERNVYGCVRFVKSEYIAIIRVKTCPDILYMVGLLAHEALHITSKILRHGLKCELDDNTEEIYCYLHDYIYYNLYDVVINQPMIKANSDN